MSGRKILVVDDDDEILGLLERRLTGAGYDVVTARRGHEAVSKAVTENPDLILLDIVLPDIDGSEVLQQIRQHPSLSRNIPVLFLSGILSADDAVSGQDITVGGHPYPALAKPILFGRLLEEINRYIDHPSVESPSSP